MRKGKGAMPGHTCALTLGQNAKDGKGGFRACWIELQELEAKDRRAQEAVRRRTAAKAREDPVFRTAEGFLGINRTDVFQAARPSAA